MDHQSKFVSLKMELISSKFLSFNIELHESQDWKKYTHTTVELKLFCLPISPPLHFKNSLIRLYTLIFFLFLRKDTWGRGCPFWSKSLSKNTHLRTLYIILIDYRNYPNLVYTRKKLSMRLCTIIKVKKNYLIRKCALNSG